MSTRPKRRVRIKSEVPIKPPRKWKDKEMETLLNCIIKYGHKDLNKIQEQLPGRSIENIKTFMRTVYDTACKMTKHDEILDNWIKHCDTCSGTSWNDCIQIAQVIKYLSVDGLLENHPLPERCQGIDFGQAYRLVYQAMMGYPIQAVNQPTADFVIETLAELNGEIIKQSDAIAKVQSFLHKESKDVSNPASDNPEVSNNETNGSAQVKKPLKVYQRKKSVVPAPTETKPSLKIVVQEAPNGVNSGSGCSKNFSVTVEGTNATESTIVNVPQACEVVVDEDEEELLKSLSYNPFQLPKKWLEEPLYLNLLQKL